MFLSVSRCLQPFYVDNVYVWSLFPLNQVLPQKVPRCFYINRNGNDRSWEQCAFRTEATKSLISRERLGRRPRFSTRREASLDFSKREAFAICDSRNDGGILRLRKNYSLIALVESSLPRIERTTFTTGHAERTKYFHGYVSAILKHRGWFDSSDMAKTSDLKTSFVVGFHGPSPARVPRERAENREFYNEYHSEPSFVARVLRDYSCLLSKYAWPWPWPNTFFLSSRRLFRTWREINRFSLPLRTYTSTWDVFMHRLSPFSRACW